MQSVTLPSALLQRASRSLYDECQSVFGRQRSLESLLGGERLNQMAQWFSSWIGWVRVVATLGLCLGLVVRVGDPLLLSSLRNAAFDLYHQSKPRNLTQMPVAILDIDDASIEELGQWPWPRTRIAEMVTLAMQDVAVVVGFDIVFSEPDRLSPPQIVRDKPDLPPDLA